MSNSKKYQVNNCLTMNLPGAVLVGKASFVIENEFLIENVTFDIYRETDNKYVCFTGDGVLGMTSLEAILEKFDNATSVVIIDK